MTDDSVTQCGTHHEALTGEEIHGLLIWLSFAVIVASAIAMGVALMQENGRLAVGAYFVSIPAAYTGVLLCVYGVLQA